MKHSFQDTLKYEAETLAVVFIAVLGIAILGCGALLSIAYLVQLLSGYGGG